MTTTYTILITPTSASPTACVDNGGSVNFSMSPDLDLCPGDQVSYLWQPSTSGWSVGSTFVGLLFKDNPATDFDPSASQVSSIGGCTPAGYFPGYLMTATSNGLTVTVKQGATNGSYSYTLWFQSTVGDWFYDPELDVSSPSGTEIKLRGPMRISKS